MGRPIPLPIWDRRAGRPLYEWMDDHAPTYESEPRRSIMQWLESQPIYDWFVAASQNTSWSKRTFPRLPHEMGAFAEARYFAWERIQSDQMFPVKGRSLSASHILGKAVRALPFAGGPVLLARLAPVDYHHVHYPDDGVTLGA